MSAYVLVHVDVTHPVEYEEYKKISGTSIAAYGGRFLVRGGRAQVMEGNWEPKRLVIVEFPSVEQARTWWESPEYAPAKAKRQATAKSELVIIEGV